VGSYQIKVEDWAPICRATNDLNNDDEHAVQKFFEKWFVPHLVSTTENSQGLFTGYFEAELRGSKKRSAQFKVPLYGLPTDLKHAADGRILPYHRRGAIQKGALRNVAPILVWVDDAIDAFLLHVQGSGRVVLENGAVMRVGYAGNNGHDYVSIGRVLIGQGELSPGRAGWTQIRNWIVRHPLKAEALLAQNPRFIFFRKVLGEGPIGAQGVALTPRRSLAVDRKFIPLGFPIWLETVWPGQTERPLRRLMIAQDTGSAIKGPIRGDFFWGYGKDALAEAGRMKSLGQYYILLPKSVTAPLS
jgi:membrane-bound lytic murein transglycosylase A